MDHSSQDKLLRQLNVLPVAVMCLVCLAPMFMFWGAAFGPLKPFDYPEVDTAPPWVGFVLFGLLSFLPCTFGPWYYRAREDDAALHRYERMGIRQFKRFVSSGDYINRRVRRHTPGYRIVFDAASASSFLKSTMTTERSHLILFLMGLLTAFYALWIGWYLWFLVLMSGNILTNLYPCLVQRYNRARILRLRERWGLKLYYPAG